MGGWVGGGSIASHFYIYIYDCRSRVQAPPSPLSPQWYGEGDADAADNPEEALQETPGQGDGGLPRRHLARGRGDATDKPEEASSRLLADELVSLNFFVFLRKWPHRPPQDPPPMVADKWRTTLQADKWRTSGGQVAEPAL